MNSPSFTPVCITLPMRGRGRHKKHGLLSASALLDLFGVVREDRKAIEGEQRPEQRLIVHPTYGAAIIHDQKPLQEAKLRK